MDDDNKSWYYTNCDQYAVMDYISSNLPNPANYVYIDNCKYCTAP